jgi:hypothetical protein
MQRLILADEPFVCLVKERLARFGVLPARDLPSPLLSATGLLQGNFGALGGTGAFKGSEHLRVVCPAAVEFEVEL